MLLIPEATRGVTPLSFSIVVAHTAAHHAAASKLPTEPYTQGRRLLALCKKSARALGVAVVCCDLDYPVRMPWPLQGPEKLPEGFVYVELCYIDPAAPGLVPWALLKAIWMWSVGRGVHHIVACGSSAQQAAFESLGLVALDSNEDKTLFVGQVHHVSSVLAKANPELYSFFYKEQHRDIRIVRGCAPTTG